MRRRGIRNIQCGLKGLDRSPVEISNFFKNDQDSEGNQHFKPVDMDTYHMIADWYYYAILSLVETEDFKSSEPWIATRLGLPVSTVKEAIGRLLKLGLLKLDPAKKIFKVSGVQLATVPAVAAPALKKACRQNIDLAQKALEQAEFHERDFTAITLCFDPKRMDEAKRMIKNFRRNFTKVMESQDKKEVYKLSINLIPLTKRGLK